MKRTPDGEVDLVPQKDTSRVPRDSVRISAVDEPGWEAVAGRIPAVGERVWCVEGPAEVVKLCGRISDGSRLIELRLADRPSTPFFAASSNVLMRVTPILG